MHGQRVETINVKQHVQEVRDLIKRLLVHNPNQRLGALKAGAADVKAHPWFANFDWAAFSKRQMKAPYIPQVDSFKYRFHNHIWRLEQFCGFLQL